MRLGDAAYVLELSHRPKTVLRNTGAVADNILELQRAFDDAELRGDADRLDALLADEFLSIGEQGCLSPQVSPCPDRPVRRSDLLLGWNASLAVASGPILERGRGSGW